MSVLNDEKAVADLIKNNDMTIVYFTGMVCGACEAVKEKIEAILKKYPKIKYAEVNGEDNAKIAAKYEAYLLPVCLVFTEGKEAIRIGRNIDLEGFESNIKRYYDMLF